MLHLLHAGCNKIVVLLFVCSSPSLSPPIYLHGYSETPKCQSIGHTDMPQTRHEHSLNTDNSLDMVKAHHGLFHKFQKHFEGSFGNGKYFGGNFVKYK